MRDFEKFNERLSGKNGQKQVIWLINCKGILFLKLEIYLK